MLVLMVMPWSSLCVGEKTRAWLLFLGVVLSDVHSHYCVVVRTICGGCAYYPHGAKFVSLMGEFADEWFCVLVFYE